MHLILGLTALIMLAWTVLVLIRERAPTPGIMFGFGWGLVTLLGAVEVVRYSPLSLEGVSVTLAFVAYLAIIFLLMPRPARGGPMAGLAADPSSAVLQVARVFSLLVLAGIALRYVHSVVIYERPLFDVQRSYEITNTEVMAGTWFSRIGSLLFLWPLPAAVLAWHAVNLGWWDRLLLFCGSMGLAAFGLMQGGRSGLVFTVFFIVPLALLSMAKGPGAAAPRRKRLTLVAGTGLFAVLSFALLLVMFGLRTTDAISGGRYARFMEVNPRYAGLVNPYGGSLLQDGVLGAVGYGTQPVQRLSLFFELDVETRFYGAWNFDVFANILRRVGIGTEHYNEAFSQVTYTYLEQGVPPGTFSTCIRDLYLDFGWAGVLLGGFAFAGGAQWVYARLLSGQAPHLLPLLGFMYGLIGVSPLFSGMQVGGANLSLCGALAGCLALYVRGRAAPVRPAPARHPGTPPPRRRH